MVTNSIPDLNPGDPAPDFSLPDADGKIISLKDFGGDLILYFYPKDDTPGCTKQACGFRDLWDEITKLGVAVIGISPDDANSHREFREKYQLPFPLLCDPDKQTMIQYGAWGEKILYSKKHIGVIRTTLWIRNGIIHKRWKRVANAAAHPQQILHILQTDLQKIT